MNIIVVDDEKLALNSLVSKLREVEPKAEIKGFLHPEEALEIARNGYHPDIAFLDIEMYGMNGIELAIKFKEVYPKINLIFVTGFQNYMPDAFSIRASGYITKPAAKERILEELNNLRNPVIKEKAKRIVVQTFGNFEVFYEGLPLVFKRSRTKELLAYLIDRRGAGVTMFELASILYEERPSERTLQNQVRVHISDLMKTLKKIDESDMIVRRRNFIAVDINRVECDYYQVLKGDIAAINSFHGEYMTSYSWAEFTLGRLYRTMDKF